MKLNRIYIYGIVPNFYSTEIFRSLEDSGLYAIGFQNITAIVSDRNTAPLTSLNRESLGHLLVHHQKTLEEIMDSGFTMLIPMKLGTIVNFKMEVVKILEYGYDLIIETLKKVELLIEMDMVVTWADFGATLNEVSLIPEVIELKNEIQNNLTGSSQIDQVKFGMLVQAKLKEKNTLVELSILDKLSSCGVDIRTHEVMNDEMITNSAFLLKRSKLDTFNDLIDQMDEEFEGKLNFKIVGPLPCYSFYTLEISELNQENVLNAKKDLGLTDNSSVSEIKKAYLEKAKLFHPDTQLENGDKESFDKINKAYRTLLNYSAAVRQTSKEDSIGITHDKVKENLILVKIKD